METLGKLTIRFAGKEIKLSGSPHRRQKAGQRQVVSVMEATSRIMGDFGEEQRGCYVWWGGYFTASGDAQVLTAYCPDIATDYGRVHLRLGDFHSLYSALREWDQVLIVELHTHPPGAGRMRSMPRRTQAL